MEMMTLSDIRWSSKKIEFRGSRRPQWSDERDGHVVFVC